MRILPDRSRQSLAAGLAERREEIIATIAARVYAIDPPDRNADPEYVEGLRLAIIAAIDDTIAAACGGDRGVEVAVAIIAQARLAARRRVPIETVLRRYQAGHSVLGDFVLEEAEQKGIAPGVLRWVLRAQAVRTDQVVAELGRRYIEETRAARPLTTDMRQVTLVRQLLDGELVDPAGLDYDLARPHMGLIVQGPDGGDVACTLARRLGWRMLHVMPDEQTSWAWLSTYDGFDLAKQHELQSFTPPGGVFIGLGEPATGAIGWRLTHRQARAALSVALRSKNRPLARYADVALLAAALQDDLLATSLRQLILEPLLQERDGGKALRDTLNAYLICERNITSTAAKLGVNRNTVTSRLRAAEDRLGPLWSRSAQLAVALRLADATEPTS